MRRHQRGEDDPDRPPPTLTFTDPRTGEVTTTVPTPEVAERRPRGLPRRRVLVAAGAALVLVIGAVTAFLLLRDDPVTGSGGFRLPSAVDSRPAEAWTHDLAAEASIAAVGDHVLMTDGESGIVGLDRDGREVWSYDDHQASFLRPSGVDDVAIAVGEGVSAVSAEDGAELWWRDVTDSVEIDGESVLLLDSGTLRRIDVRSGVETWSVEGVESQLVGGGAVYVVTDGELRRLDAESGRVDWAVDIRSGPAVDGLPVAANDDLVVLVGGFAVTAYAAADGAEAWTSEGSRGSGGGLSVGVWSDERVYLATTTYVDDGDSNGGEVEVRDLDGTVGTFDVAPDDDLYGTAVRAGGEEWFLDIGSGGLYDERLERVVDYRGQVTPADDGAYTLGGDELRYYPYGETDPTWSLPVEAGRDAYLTAADDLLLVTEDGTLTAYR